METSTPHQPSSPLLYIASKQADIYQQLLAQSALKDIPITKDSTQATIVLADPPMLANTIDQFPKMEWVQATYAGIDTLTKDHLPKNYQLTNVKGIFGQLISEYVLSYAIGFYRHFPQYKQQQQQSLWQPHEYQSIVGKKMVIVGTGSIGLKLAETATALGFIAIGVNRSGQLPEQNAFQDCFTIEQIDDALKQADIVVNALPNTTQTHQLINRAHLSHCREAVFFNIGRGDTVVDEDLLTALDNGSITHAYLDVFSKEPLSTDSPYWLHPKVTITPHIAANSFPEQVFVIFEQNYQRWVNKQPLLNQVDFERGY